MSLPPSPSSLIPAPPRRAPGVKRLNRVPYYIAGGFGAVVIIGIGGTLLAQNAKRHAEAVSAEADKKPKGGGVPSWMQWPTDHGAVQADVTKPVGHGEIPADKVAFASPVSPAPIIPVQPQTAPSDLQEQARSRAWAAYYQQVEAVQQARFTAAMAARQPQTSRQNDDAPANPSPSFPPRPVGGGRELPYSVGGVDPPGQTGKQAFLRTPGDPFGQNEDLPGSVHGPKLSTIMEGNFIPLRLIEGATSDSPGQLNAEVTTDVNDTATGDILLIPQWTRFVGEYDTAVSAGQDRLGIIWHRMIFPDSSSRQIGTVAGADQAGLAGAKDKLNTHLWDKFSSALLISLVGAGAQLAQPQQSSAFSNPNPASAATGQFTQQFSQLGQAYAQRGLSIPNTIELRPGLMVMAKVNADWKLPAYVDQRR